MPPPTPVPSSLANEAANVTHTRAEHNVGVAVKFMSDIVGIVVRDPAEEAEKNERGGQSNSVVYIFRWVSHLLQQCCHADNSAGWEV